MKKIVLFLIVLLVTSGCYNYKELNDLGLVTAIGISKDEDEYILDVQLVNILEAGKNGITEAPISVLSSKGKTIFEAARSLNLKSPKVFFISNLEYVLIDDFVIKEDIGEVIDYLTRDARLPLNFLIVTSIDDKPKEIMSSLSQFDINSASNLSKILKLSEDKYGESYALTIKDLLNKYLSKNSTAVYPNIKLVGNSEELSNLDNLKNSDSDNYVEIEGLIFINNENQIIKLSKEEAFGYNFIQNNITNASLTAKCEGGYFTAETMNSKFEYVDNLKNDELLIKGNNEVEIAYYGCKEKLKSEEITQKLENILNELLTEYVKSTIKVAQDNKSDIIEAGSFIYKNNNKYFDFNKKNWNEDGFPKLKFEYDIKTKIVKQGNLRGDINE